jgi:SAM-dependent methyltransferase
VPATTAHNAADYEKRYREGYGLAYPESHIIRVNKHILEWELGMRGGRVFDFGCGAGAHLKYFADHGYEPFGCDTSETAIATCQRLMPERKDNFRTTPVNPDLPALFGKTRFDLFLSNQVLYFLDDAGIASIVEQAHRMLVPGGVFIATMMASSCWYARYIKGEREGFRVVQLDTPRQKGELLINFKTREELVELFGRFKVLHVGFYGSHIRQEEGSTDHWLFVGRKAKA